jgi:hypothetical protein
MHLEIDHLHFDGDKMSIDFEYDDDFQKKVAKVCGLNHISKKDLQSFIVLVMQHAISKEDILKLRNQID